MKAKALLLLTIACLLAMAQSKSRPLVQPKKTNDNKANRKLLVGGLRIYVRYQGTQYPVDLEPDATVADIREALQSDISAALVYHSFVNAGEELKNEEAALANIGVGQEAEVDVKFNAPAITSRIFPSGGQVPSGTELQIWFIRQEHQHIKVAISICPDKYTLHRIIQHIIITHDEASECTGDEWKMPSHGRRKTFEELRAEGEKIVGVLYRSASD